MTWALAAIGVGLALGLIALFWRYTLQLNVQGRGDPSGQWALAGGAKVGFLSVAGVSGRGATPTVLVHLFGRSVLQRDMFGDGDADENEDEDDEESSEDKSLRERYDALARWVDPFDLAEFVFSERRRIAVPVMELELDYSFEDVVLTGQLMSAVHMLNGVLPAPMVVRQSVSWEFVDRGAFVGRGELACRPGLVLWDVCVFLWNHLQLRQPAAVAGAEG